MDLPLLVILLLLGATLTAWATGLLVWPVGFLVLLSLLIARMLFLYGKGR